MARLRKNWGMAGRIVAPCFRISRMIFFGGCSVFMRTIDPPISIGSSTLFAAITGTQLSRWAAVKQASIKFNLFASSSRVLGVISPPQSSIKSASAFAATAL